MITLTEDQRHLLTAYDPGLLAGLIRNPEQGLGRIKSACAGGSARRHNGPEWLRWYETGGAGIKGGLHGDWRVTITWAQLSRWAATVPDEIRAKLVANHAEWAEERDRTDRWCRCGRAQECLRRNAGDPIYGDRHHPTDAEDNEHTARVLRINAYQRVFVGQAIWATTEPDQMDLFSEAAS